MKRTGPTRTQRTPGSPAGELHASSKLLNFTAPQSWAGAQQLLPGRLNRRTQLPVVISFSFQHAWQPPMPAAQLRGCC